MYTDLPKTNQTADIIRSRLNEANDIKIELLKAGVFQYDILYNNFIVPQGLQLVSIDIGNDRCLNFTIDDPSMDKKEVPSLLYGAFIRYLNDTLQTAVSNGMDRMKALVLSSNFNLYGNLMMSVETYLPNKFTLRI